MDNSNPVQYTEAVHHFKGETMRKLFLGLLIIMTAGASHANPLINTEAKSTRLHSEKQLRSVLSQIPLDLNTCLAKIDRSYPNVLLSLYCDGDLVIKNLTLVQTTAIFQSVSLEQSSTLFMSAMLDSGFDLKSLDRSNAFETYIFQRTRPKDKLDSNSF